MANEPMPWQLTVGQLRGILRDVPDGVVVGLQVPAPGIGHPELTIFCNLRVEYAGGMLVRLIPIADVPTGSTSAST
jgi:hypothetical protein